MSALDHWLYNQRIGCNHSSYQRSIFAIVCFVWRRTDFFLGILIFRIFKVIQVLVPPVKLHNKLYLHTCRNLVRYCIMLICLLWISGKIRMHPWSYASRTWITMVEASYSHKNDDIAYTPGSWSIPIQTKYFLHPWMFVEVNLS